MAIVMTAVHLILESILNVGIESSIRRTAPGSDQHPRECNAVGRQSPNGKVRVGSTTELSVDGGQSTALSGRNSLVAELVKSFGIAAIVESLDDFRYTLGRFIGFLEIEDTVGTE